MNAIFTVVAKNYLALARTLGDSIKAMHPDLPFYIFLSDEADGYLDLSNEKHETIEVKSIGNYEWEDMAFKYDVTEYATAVKPYVFQYLFEKFDFEHIIYLDPDMYLFKPIDAIINEFRENDFMVATPHLAKPTLDFDGLITEEEIHFVGICNFGFVAFKNCERGHIALEWWAKKLTDKCYIDKMESLHVDQKWSDLLFGFFPDNIKVSHHQGFNISNFNMHERKLINENGEYFVVDRENEMRKDELVFYHFSGFNPKFPEIINKRHQQDDKFDISRFNEFKEIYKFYSEKVLANGFEKQIIMPYSYSKFENGINLVSFHRRIYRELTGQGEIFSSPFSSNGPFYKLLKKNGLLSLKNKDVNLDKVNNATLQGVDKKRRILLFCMSLLKGLIGINNYILLIKFFKTYIRYESHTFLIKKR